VNPQVGRHAAKVETDSCHESLWASLLCCMPTHCNLGVLDAYALEASPGCIWTVSFTTISHPFEEHFLFLVRQAATKVEALGCIGLRWAEEWTMKRWAEEWTIAARLHTGPAAGGLDSRYGPRACSGAPALAPFGFLGTHTDASNASLYVATYVASNASHTD